MSSLIFYTDENQAIVATDTLATLDKGEPCMFTTKTHILPHLNMMICGTGFGGFLGQWFIEINDRMAVRDIDDLDNYAPRYLNEIWVEWNKKFSVPIDCDCTSTVYHFGFSAHTGLMTTYVYRSTNDFTSNSLGIGSGFKPPCEVPDNWRIPEDFLDLMNQQRAIQMALPENERVYIGGEINVHHLTRDGYAVGKAGRFDDYEETAKAIRNLHFPQDTDAL